MPHLFFVKRHRARARIYLSSPATSSIKFDMAYFSTAETEDDTPAAGSLTLIYEGQLATQDIVRAAAVAFGDTLDGVMEKDGGSNQAGSTASHLRQGNPRQTVHPVASEVVTRSGRASSRLQADRLPWDILFCPFHVTGVLGLTGCVRILLWYVYLIGQPEGTRLRDAVCNCRMK